MKYTQPNHNRVKLDWIIAQALGEQRVDGELYRLRATHENNLRIKQNVLKSRYEKIQSLKSKLNEDSDAQFNGSIRCDDLLTEASIVLPRKASDLQHAECRKEAFRLRHGLSREPISPQTSLNLMFLAILVFLEAGLNASFFQNASMVATPFAALLTSFLISITNVLACASAGYFIGRWKEYGLNGADADSPEFSSRRTQARWLFWGFLLALAFFHATVGLVRALESLEAVHHSLINYLILLTTPEAVFLIMTGACLSVLAYHKGKHAFSDPYPNFSEHQNAVTNCHDELFDTYNDYSQQIEERFDDAIHDMENSGKSQSKILKKYNHSVESCHEARRNLENAKSEAESHIRMQLAQIINHHQAAQGRHAQNPEMTLDHLVSFEGFPEVEMPAYQSPPNISTHRAELLEAKARALSRLNEIFQNLFDNDQEKCHEKTFTK